MKHARADYECPQDPAGLIPGAELIITTPDLHIRNLFYPLWTRAVGQPGYVKQDWMELERLLTDHGLLV